MFVSISNSTCAADDLINHIKLSAVNSFRRTEKKTEDAGERQSMNPNNTITIDMRESTLFSRNRKSNKTKTEGYNWRSYIYIFMKHSWLNTTKGLFNHKAANEALRANLKLAMKWKKKARDTDLFRKLWYSGFGCKAYSNIGNFFWPQEDV